MSWHHKTLLPQCLAATSASMILYIQNPIVCATTCTLLYFSSRSFVHVKFTLGENIYKAKIWLIHVIKPKSKSYIFNETRYLYAYCLSILASTFLGNNHLSILITKENCANCPPNYQYIIQKIKDNGYFVGTICQVYICCVIVEF